MTWLFWGRKCTKSFLCVNPVLQHYKGQTSPKTVQVTLL